MTDNTELLKDLLLAKCTFQLKAIESALTGQCAAIHTSIQDGEIVVREISHEEMYIQPEGIEQ